MRLTGVLLTSLCTVIAVRGQSSAVHRLDRRVLAPAEIDNTVKGLIDAGRVTGAGIALFENGYVVFEKAYGYRDVERKLPLTPDSVMTAASLTKAAFAAMLMGLAEEGRIDLDRPIERYLPKPLPEYAGYEDLQNDTRWKKLTLRILMSHTSGFPNWRRFEANRKLTIHFDPGSRYGYSGEGIDLAQFVVEYVTGQPLETLMRERLFKRVGMSRTSMTWQLRFENDFANRYDEAGASLGRERRTKADAAGSMQTTTRDYAALLSAIMQRRGIDSKAAKEMFSPQIAIHSLHQFPSLATATTTQFDPVHLSYGIGWGIYTSPYGRAFFKEGHDEGWRHLALCFESGSGILIMTNSSNGEGIFKPLIDALLGNTAFPFEWETYTPYNQTSSRR